MKKNILISVEAETLTKLLSIFPKEDSEVAVCELTIEYFLKNYETNYGKVEYLNKEKQENVNIEKNPDIEYMDLKEDFLE